MIKNVSGGMYVHDFLPKTSTEEQMVLIELFSMGYILYLINISLFQRRSEVGGAPCAWVSRHLQPQRRVPRGDGVGGAVPVDPRQERPRGPRRDATRHSKMQGWYKQLFAGRQGRKAFESHYRIIFYTM